MNKNHNKNIDKEIENVSGRLKNAEREIEQLKTDVHKLVNLQQKKTVPVPPKRPDPVQTSLAKSKNYNVEEARDYIKKQKEKRTEQLKTQINAADTKLDLKKQKLRELHQKTVELIRKNVHSKRERSKSRDKVPPVRLDRSNPRAVSNTRVKSQERQKRPLLSQDIEAHLDERIPLEVSPELSKGIPQPPVSVRESRSRTRSGINPLQPLEVDLDQSALPPPSEPSPKSSKRIPDKKQELILPDSRSKDTKETQTVREPLKWMQYPYKFINTVETSEKSSSTIKTGEKLIPSISKPSTITNDNESQSKPSVIQDPFRFVNTNRRRGGDSQKSPKSLITASQISGSESEIFTSKPATESLILKEPSGSLGIRKVDLGLDVGRSLMKTITIRPAIGEQKRERKSGGSSSGNNFNVSESNGTEESVPENLDLSRDLRPKTSPSAKSQALTLKEPTVSLNFGRGDSGRVQSKNITIQPATSTASQEPDSGGPSTRSRRNALKEATQNSSEVQAFEKLQEEAFLCPGYAGPMTRSRSRERRPEPDNRGPMTRSRSRQ